MSGLLAAALQGVAAALGVAVVALAVSALAAGARAVRIGGARLLFNGIDWFLPSARVPEAARPHMRTALRRWLLAMGTMVLAGIAAILSEVAS
ncbi:hypothetical protein GXW74_04545 [Roseomonas eburnea]|uniref:Uncharacterized protein n=1 Tax=Neoroseomonas eburnea TaxID=1346889 RepID=A0A9X9X7Q7_9PROT|nr:hypothetical protein [Neoroseomonas eburnea]MBR0679743.1 hypothetical protein [Neoroseomonas eburnea]